MSHLPTHKAHHHPSQTLQKLESVAQEVRSLFHFLYIATYHSRPLILSKLFSQVDKHEKNMTYPGLFKRDFLLNMIHCALISHCIFIKCSMPALKRTLSTPLVMADFFDSIVRWIPYQPAVENSTFQNLWEMPKGASGSLETDMYQITMICQSPFSVQWYQLLKKHILSLTSWDYILEGETDYKQIKDYMTQITLDIGKCSEDNRTGDVTWTDGVE